MLNIIEAILIYKLNIRAYTKNRHLEKFCLLKPWLNHISRTLDDDAHWYGESSQKKQSS